MGSYTNLTYHIVFSTKLRQPMITDPIRERMYEYMGGIIRLSKGSLIEIGGTADHVHLLARLSPVLAVSTVIRDIKSSSSKWYNELTETKSRFEWQKGYAAFSVSFSQVNAVREYIQNQQEHHRIKSFREEYVAFLERHQIAYKPEHLFEDEHYG